MGHFLRLSAIHLAISSSVWSVILVPSIKTGSFSGLDSFFSNLVSFTCAVSRVEFSFIELDVLADVENSDESKNGRFSVFVSDFDSLKNTGFGGSDAEPEKLVDGGGSVDAKGPEVPGRCVGKAEKSIPKWGFLFDGIAPRPSPDGGVVRLRRKGLV